MMGYAAVVAAVGCGLVWGGSTLRLVEPRRNSHIASQPKNNYGKIGKTEWREPDAG
jgi:hypothetical protein